MPPVTRTVISEDGGSSDAAEANSLVAAAIPIADNFRKVRLFCSLDTRFSWQELNVVSILRTVSNFMEHQ